MRGLVLCAALCLVVLSTPTHIPIPRPGGVAVEQYPLRSRSVVTRRGVSAESHAYTVDLDAGTFVELSVSQEAAELRVAVAAPDGSDVTAIDLPSLDPLPERLMFIASSAGTHRVEVRLTKRGEDESQNHEYSLHVLALRPANDRDRRRERCFALTARASRFARGERRGMSGFEETINLLKQAATCWQGESDVDLEASALAALAGLSGLFSEFRLDSAAALERLIPILRQKGLAPLELSTFDDLVVEYNDDGRFDRSRATAIEMRQLAARLGNRRAEGRAYQRLAFAEFSLGNYRAAREAALSALDVANEVEDAPLLGAAHLQLGRIDELAGDYEAARARYEQGLTVTPWDRQATPALTNALGFLQLRMGDHDGAARRFEARLEIAKRYVQRDTEALARVGLGDVRLARGDHEGARQMYSAAAEALRRGMPSIRCIALQRLGRLELSEKRLDEASTHFAEMLTINQHMGNPACEAEAQAGAADIALARGDLRAADTAARRVIAIAEQFREAVPNLESRALGFGALAPAFRRVVDIGMRQAARGQAGAAAQALVMNERALARGLLDQLSAAASEEPGDGTTPAELERQRVREQWRVRVAQFQVAARLPSDRDRAEKLRHEMTVLELQLRDLEARADLADARRARLMRAEALELPQIQGLLDSDTTLLEYALGEQQSYLWVVTSRGMRALRLAPRAEIEKAAQAVYRDITSPVSATQPGAAQRRYALARLVLAPAGPLLAGRRLVIVSAGALSLVPFATLPLEHGTAKDSLLLSRFEIVHTPSATTLAAMRALTERRPPPSKHTVVFADPIFETDDPRARPGDAGPERAVSTSGADERSGEAVAARTLVPLGASFPRLPFSRAEAKALSAIAPGQVTLFLDGLATRDRAIGQALGDYRFIHFATHGVVHPEVTSLSSIVLSFIDSSGARREPFLTLSDIYEMRLSADVVVLSACSTAEGRNVPGEGPIGLARGFMYAGAPRVIASLWRVNDAATAELMQRFYRGMLVEKLPAAAALRAAQQQVAAIPRWASPYYWAPFVLQGDWR